MEYLMFANRRCASNPDAPWYLAATVKEPSRPKVGPESDPRIEVAFVPLALAVAAPALAKLLSKCEVRLWNNMHEVPCQAEREWMRETHGNIRALLSTLPKDGE